MVFKSNHARPDNATSIQTLRLIVLNLQSRVHGPQGCAGCEKLACERQYTSERTINGEVNANRTNIFPSAPPKGNRPARLRVEHNLHGTRFAGEGNFIIKGGEAALHGTQTMSTYGKHPTLQATIGVWELTRGYYIF